MLTASKILKWVTVVLLLGGLVLIFAPYVHIDGAYVYIDGEEYSLINLIEFFKTNKDFIRIEAMFLVVFCFVVPVVSVTLAAFVMIFKTSTPKTVIIVILNGIALGVYYLTFTRPLLEITRENIGFGLVGNVIVSGLGVVLPIIVLILAKVGNRKAIKNHNA